MLATEGTLGTRSVTELHESPANPRMISGSRLTALKADLEHDPTMLWARPIIATPDGTVVAGNMRLRAAQEMGWEEIPTYTVELDETRAREWMLRDNAAYGDWVPGLLADTIAEAVHVGANTEHFGFTKAEVDGFLKKAGEQAAAAQQELPQVWGVVVECEDGHQQGELLERFAEEGLHARALMA